MAKLAESAFVLKVFAKQVPIKVSGLIFYYKCEDTNLTWLFDGLQQYTHMVRFIIGYTIVTRY